MHVPGYQIHNVLKLYSQQITRKRLADDSSPSQPLETKEDPTLLSAEGKRESMIQKITSDIVERITKDGPQDSTGTNRYPLPEEESWKTSSSVREDSEQKFVYNTLDDRNRKTTRSVSLKDADIVLKRLAGTTAETQNRRI
ncbi:hypothetical protein OOT00_00675 [Desulfobotulus sp. H1]|uniref:Uncharacterized protein n=1 Tax=Desulfobotulus pelophilus TaxID=2823377 RepID=A0ABT3N4V3_9BACT|nr:DVU0524 family FlgM-associated protein [Desulfobotulus pelophilus]MCW7752493.1 hypothetical protein [Desulfobotulus pelophilus]